MGKRSKNWNQDEYYEDDSYEESKKDKNRDIIRKANRRMKSAMNTRDVEEIIRLQDEY